MKKLTIILLSLIIAQTSFGTSFKELQEPPHDSLNAKKMKIWFPVKMEQCQVHIRILDSKMKHVRELVNKSIKKGYYNIFWDKKDDSGNYVLEGVYKTALISCGYKRLLPIKIKYVNGENLVLISSGDDLNNPSIELTLLQDSLQVSLDILNVRMNHTATLFVDSLITGRNVSFNWEPDAITPTGKYFYKLKVNDFEHLMQFRYKK